MNLGAPELVAILIIVFLLFGATRLPKLARSLGEASKEFKKGVEDSEREHKSSAPRPDDKVTMTNAELDALLAEREARGRRDAPPTSP
ncbi:MAG TPA: twin-arginine translocase TatA/TatE family subunit [Acidimicrobiales bacterium]|jgi:sec-independent protein translocase protein TatA|nr:twin-arginine translocase TatA/TatE family subunit [Acidimicrobiales bacterium]